MELWFARTWIVIAALFVASINAAAVIVLYIGIRHWREDLSKDLNSNIWISSVVVTMLNLIMLGVMNVGQATEILGDKLEGIAWLFAAVLVPLVTGKTITKFGASKYGTTESAQSPPTGGTP